MTATSRLFISPGYILFIGHSVDAIEHQHHAVQLCIGLEQPFHLEYAGERHESRAALLPANTPHRFDGRGGQQLILLIAPELESVITQLARQLTHSFELPTELSTALIKVIHTQNVHNSEQASHLIRSLIQALSGQQLVDKVTPDKRIQQIITHIHDSSVHKLSSDSLASLVGLSTSRFAHLFKQQLGLPVRRYILWARLIRGVESAIECGSLTQGAHSAGFADSAHFSRTFRQTFGLTPASILKNSQFVQVSICPDP